MDFDRIRYFKTIVETGSLKQAAEILHVSPPALSKAMKLLEEETRLKLFIAAGRGLAVTDEGQAFYDRAKPLFAAYEALTHGTLGAKAVQNDELRIGTFEVFSTHFVGPAVEKFFAGRPLVLHELGPGALEAALSDGRIDLGLTYMPIPRPDLDFLKISTIQMGIFSAESARFRDEDFNEIPFAVPVAPVHGSPTRIQGLDGWPDHRLPRKVAFQVTLMESALELCRRGLAAAYLPEFVVRLHNAKVLAKFQLVKMAAPKKIATDSPVYLVKRKSDQERSDAKKLAAAVRQFCLD